jgi:uncharacterized membrane protein
MSSRFDVLQLGICALVALLALQIIWHGWWSPPAPAQLWPTLVLSILPLLPGLWISRTNLRRGVLVGAIVCLFYFCHGVGAAYADAQTRVLALVEISLTLLVIGTSGWEARHYKRPAK